MASAWLDDIRRAGREWGSDNCPRLAAALSYYAVFAFPPLLLIVIAIAGAAFGTQRAHDAMVHEVGQMVGPDARKLVESALSAATRSWNGPWATAFGVLLLILTSSGAFLELHSSLNIVWGVRSLKGKPLLRQLRERLVSFTMVVSLGFLMLVSLVLSAIVTWVSHLLGGAGPGILYEMVNAVLSMAAFTGLIALIYKVLPDAEVAWPSVWIGAALTALLLVAGKAAIGLYLGRGALTSAYGAAGALAAMLAWVYYVGLVFFFGAELTQVRAERRGELKPRRGATRVEEVATAPPNARKRSKPRRARAG